MRADSFRPPVTLEGRYIRLVPMVASHATALRSAADHPEVGRYLLNGPGTTRADIEALIALLIERQSQQTDLPFTTVRTSDGLPVGMTRFLHIDRPNEAVEIGGTWLDRRYWRTPFNTEAKYLLMRHAFERESAHRVCLQTDLRNERAQRAIERLGAIQEAVLREDRLLSDGRFRSSVFYSVLKYEWPQVKLDLEAKLARPWDPTAAIP